MINALSKPAGLVLAMLASSAQANPLPTYDISLLEVGTVFEWETNRGLQSMTYLGPDDGLFRIRLRYSNVPDDMAVADRWLTRSGQSKKIAFDDFSIILAPHNCQNTVGHCGFFQMFSLFDSFKISYFGTYTDDGVLVATRSTPDSELEAFPKKRCSILDPYGVTIVSYSIDPTGNTFWERRLNSQYDPEIASMTLRVEASCNEDIPIS